MGGRKPSQTTALDAILEITQKYKKEVLAAAEKVGRCQPKVEMSPP